MITRDPITISTRYYTRLNGRVFELIDSLRSKVIAEADALAHMTGATNEGLPAPVEPPEMLRACKKLNARDFSRRRQYGESRAAFAVRSGRHDQ